LRLVRVVEQVGRGDQRRRPGHALERRRQPRVGLRPLAAPEGAARPVVAERRPGHHQRAERLAGEPAAGADPDEPPRAEPDQLFGHDRGAGAAHAGALDREQAAVGRRAGVAPQPAVGVEHPDRRREQVLREPQRAAGVAGQQHALGDVAVRLQVQGRERHATPHGTRLARAMAKKDNKKKSKKKDNSGADPVGAVRTAVERTFHATADSAQSTRTRAQDLVDEVAGAAGRLREMIEQVGVLEDLKKQVDSLARRVQALEGGGRTAAKPASSGGRSTASRAKSSGATTRKPAASRSTAAKTSSSRAKPAASKRSTSSRSTAAKSSGSTASRSTSRSSGSGARKSTSSRSPAAKKTS
jgi:hypothetical protein